MQVFINGRFASQALTGVQRYAIELLRAVDRELGRTPSGGLGDSFHILTPRNTSALLPTFNQIPAHQVGRLNGHAWEQLELPWYARGGLLLSLGNTGPLLKWRQIVTIHDASIFALPDAYSAVFRRWYRFLLPTLGRVVSLVVTDSEFSKSELVRYAHIPAEKIRVIPLSGEHIRGIEPDCGILARLSLDSRAYILAVGSQSPHKNFRVVADALKHLGDRKLDVVVAGAPNPRVFALPPGGLGPELKIAGYVSDGELRTLYEHAICFVYPSLYEGFGLPPLEAMSCGCPVVVSRAASLSEVCGNAAVYCDPRDPASVAESVERVMRDGGLQERLRALGRSRSLQFTWAGSARALLDLIDEVGDS